MNVSMSLSRVGLFVGDLDRMVERHARTLPGFRPIAEWHAGMRARLAQAG